MPLHVSSTKCSSSGCQKLYYTASGVITPVGGRPVHRLRAVGGRPVHRLGAVGGRPVHRLREDSHL